MQALRARASIMFSGESGAAVASGIDGDAAVAEKPSYGLARAAIKIVDDLPDALRPLLAALAEGSRRSLTALAGALHGLLEIGDRLEVQDTIEYY